MRPDGILEVPMFFEAALQRFVCLVPCDGRRVGVRIDSSVRATLLMVPGPVSDVEAGAFVSFTNRGESVH